MTPTFFIIARKQVPATSNNTDLGLVVSWYESILLNGERPFEAIVEEEWPALLVSSRYGRRSSITAMAWNEEPLFGGRLVSPQEWRNQMIEHVTAQATNASPIGLRGAWPEEPIESFLSMDWQGSPVALSVNVELNMIHFSDCPDFHCHLMLVDHFNSMATGYRKGVGDGMMRMHQGAEHGSLSVIQRLAESLPIGHGQYLPISVVSDAREIAGVLRINSLERTLASSTLFLVDGGIKLNKGTELIRSASVICGAIRRCSTAVVGTLV